MKHSWFFFFGLSLIFILLIILLPRKAQEALAPTFCANDKEAGNFLSCIGSHPAKLENIQFLQKYKKFFLPAK
jgi:hypothetical protein